MKHYFITLILLGSVSFAQDYGTGVLLDDSLYINSPKSAPLLRGDFLNLPSSVSLKTYCPTPGNQGGTSTCVGWAVAYSGRTILEAIKNNWQKETTDKNTYSPSYVYNQIRPTDDCTRGTSMLDALDIIKNQGDLLLNEFDFDCNRVVNETDKSDAKEHRIIEYRQIFGSKEKKKILNTKKSLSELKPVIIAMDCPKSFNYASEVWNPDTSDYKDFSRGHCVAVVSYDDNKYGGAFEILNSWGSHWGKEGFTFIKYSDFDFFARLGFEIIDTSHQNQAEPDLSGSLLFKENNKHIMTARFNGDYFVMDSAYSSGTLFKLIVSNNEPAFVYAFGSDLSQKCTLLFPFEEKMSACLPYKQNNIAIPGEDYSCQLDENDGTTYFCFLYSKKELDIKSILSEIEKSEGNLWERIQAALKDDTVQNYNIKFEAADKIMFNAKSMGKSVVPLLVSIDHKKK